MKDAQIAALLEPVLAGLDLELEAIEIVPAGKRSLLRVVVDGEGPTGTGPLLDDLGAASSAVSLALDTSDVTGAGSYTLEVTSRGVSRPLTLPRHWRRNAGRLVEIATTAGETWTGRITGADDEGADMETSGASRRIAYADVTRAVVQVELNRRPAPAED